MFSTISKIEKRSGKDKVGRFQFLKQLMEEFRSTKVTEAKHQVLANLANFSYDPVNYGHLRTLGVLDIFLEQLSEDDPILVRFALGGLCNLALDNENKEHIVSSGGIAHISRCLLSTCTESVIYAITTLMFLISSKSKSEITNDANIAQMILLEKHADQRLKNLTTIFLEDYCDKNQVHKVRNSVKDILVTAIQASQEHQS